MRHFVQWLAATFEPFKIPKSCHDLVGPTSKCYALGICCSNVVLILAIFIHKQEAITFKQPVVYEVKCNIDYILFFSQTQRMAQPAVSEI